jgi:hypothetical protein
MDEAIPVHDEFNLIAFICFSALGLPYFFTIAPCSLTLNLNSTHAQTVWFTCHSSYGLSDAAQVYNYINVAIKDILPTLVEIALNIASVYFLKQYMNERAKLLSGGFGTQTAANTIQMQTFIKLDNNTRANQDAKVAAPREKVSKSDQKLTIMVAIMCVLSLLEHIFMNAANFYLYIGSDQVIFNLVVSVGFLASSFKHGTNFVLFYIFNTKFRSVCIRFFKRAN